MKRETINPRSLFELTKYGFSQIVISIPGKLVFIPGQVAWDDNLKIVGVNDLAKQTQKSIDNIEIALKAIGDTLENIVLLRIYRVNYQKEDGLIISKNLNQNFGILNPPASTWVSVEGLVNEGIIIEIETQAII